MPDFVFPGYPAYLDRAAEALGLDVPRPAGRVPGPLAEVAHLCAQASVAGAGDVAAILHEASVGRDRLAIAAAAAGLMLEDIADARMPAAPTEARPDPAARPNCNRP